MVKRAVQTEVPESRWQKEGPTDLRVGLPIVAMVGLIMGGLGLIAYPTLSDSWNGILQKRVISSYRDAVSRTDRITLDVMLDEAEDYNYRLLDKPNRFEFIEAERNEYLSLLDWTGTGVMGYVRIDVLDVRIPLYHGDSETVLQRGIGHVPGTSLPVGGESTHAVVTGHRGLPSAKLFSDIDKLSEGDTFSFTVLDRTCTYEVDQIKVVDPDDASDLEIVEGLDYATLVTCTPYGVNTHRLLVRGHRVFPEVEPEQVSATEDDDAGLRPNVLTALALTCAAATAAAVALRRKRRTSTSSSHEGRHAAQPALHGKSQKTTRARCEGQRDE